MKNSNFLSHTEVIKMTINKNANDLKLNDFFAERLFLLNVLQRLQRFGNFVSKLTELLDCHLKKIRNSVYHRTLY